MDVHLESDWKATSPETLTRPLLISDGVTTEGALCLGIAGVCESVQASLYPCTLAHSLDLGPLSPIPRFVIGFKVHDVFDFPVWAKDLDLPIARPWNC